MNSIQTQFANDLQVVLTISKTNQNPSVNQHESIKRLFLQMCDNKLQPHGLEYSLKSIVNESLTDRIVIWMKNIYYYIFHCTALHMTAACVNNYVSNVKIHNQKIIADNSGIKEIITNHKNCNKPLLSTLSVKIATLIERGNSLEYTVDDFKQVIIEDIHTNAQDYAELIAQNFDSLTKIAIQRKVKIYVQQLFAQLPKDSRPKDELCETISAEVSQGIFEQGLNTDQVELDALIKNKYKEHMQPTSPKKIATKIRDCNLRDDNLSINQFFQQMATLTKTKRQIVPGFAVRAVHRVASTVQQPIKTLVLKQQLQNLHSIKPNSPFYLFSQYMQQIIAQGHINLAASDEDLEQSFKDFYIKQSNAHAGMSAIDIWRYLLDQHLDNHINTLFVSFEKDGYKLSPRIRINLLSDLKTNMDIAGINTNVEQIHACIRNHMIDAIAEQVESLPSQPSQSSSDIVNPDVVEDMAHDALSENLDVVEEMAHDALSERIDFNDDDLEDIGSIIRQSIQQKNPFYHQAVCPIIKFITLALTPTPKDADEIFKVIMWSMDKIASLWNEEQSELNCWLYGDVGNSPSDFLDCAKLFASNLNTTLAWIPEDFTIHSLLKQIAEPNSPADATVSALLASFIDHYLKKDPDWRQEITQDPILKQWSIELQFTIKALFTLATHVLDTFMDIGIRALKITSKSEPLSQAVDINGSILSWLNSYTAQWVAFPLLKSNGVANIVSMIVGYLSSKIDMMLSSNIEVTRVTTLHRNLKSIDTPAKIIERVAQTMADYEMDPEKSMTVGRIVWLLNQSLSDHSEAVIEMGYELKIQLRRFIKTKEITHFSQLCEGQDELHALIFPVIQKRTNKMLTTVNTPGRKEIFDSAITLLKKIMPQMISKYASMGIVKIAAELVQDSIKPSQAFQAYISAVCQNQSQDKIELLAKQFKHSCGEYVPKVLKAIQKIAQALLKDQNVVKMIHGIDAALDAAKKNQCDDKHVVIWVIQHVLSNLVQKNKKPCEDVRLQPSMSMI